MLCFIPTLVLSSSHGGCGVGEGGINDLFPVWEGATDVNSIIASGAVNWCISFHTNKSPSQTVIVWLRVAFT